MTSQDPKSEPASKSSRRSRLAKLATTGSLAIVIGLVLFLQLVEPKSEKKSSTPKLSGVKATQQLFAGIPQHGITLGDPKAPLTLIEFVDLQCGHCRDFAIHTLPFVVSNYVRTGKLKLELRTLAFVNENSEVSARAAAAAGLQNRMWNFAELIFYNQEKITGNTQLTDLFNSTKNLSSKKAERALASKNVERVLIHAQKFAEKNSVDSAPTFLLTRNGKSKKVHPHPLDIEGFKREIERSLKS